MLNLYEAKTRLSALVDEAAAGKEIVIAKNGRPKAKLVPYRETARTVDPEQRGTNLFWFTTFAELAAHDPLEGEIWTTAASTTPGSFL